MIHKEQFDKILKLIDAGILWPQDSYIESISTIESLINLEEFKMNITFGTTSDTYSILKLSNNLEKDIETIEALINQLRNKEHLRIGKNTFIFDWNIEILDYEVSIEDLTIGKFSDKNLNNYTILKIFNSLDYFEKKFESYLNNSLSKIFEELRNPTDLNLPDLNDYYKLFVTNKYSPNSYKDLIKNSSIKISYRITINLNKNIKGEV